MGSTDNPSAVIRTLLCKGTPSLLGKACTRSEMESRAGGLGRPSPALTPLNQPSVSSVSQSVAAAFRQFKFCAIELKSLASTTVLPYSLFRPHSLRPRPATAGPHLTNPPVGVFHHAFLPPTRASRQRHSAATPPPDDFFAQVPPFAPKIARITGNTRQKCHFGICHQVPLSATICHQVSPICH